MFGILTFDTDFDIRTLNLALIVIKSRLYKSSPAWILDRVSRSRDPIVREEAVGFSPRPEAHRPPDGVLIQMEC